MTYPPQWDDIATDEEHEGQFRHVKLYHRGKLAEQTAQVSPEDFERVKRIRWCFAPKGSGFYARNTTRVEGKPKTLWLHRFILRVSDRNTIVDHINQDGLDNRAENLRACSRSENNRNRSNYRGGAYKGVTWSRSKKRWAARINVDKRAVHLGYFDHAAEAALRYDQEARILHKEFASTNFPLGAPLPPEIAGLLASKNGIAVEQNPYNPWTNDYLMWDDSHREFTRGSCLCDSS